MTYLALTSDNHRLFVSSLSLGVGGFSRRHNLYFFRTLILKLLVETLFHRVLVLVNLFQLGIDIHMGTKLLQLYYDVFSCGRPIPSVETCLRLVFP